MNYSIWTGWQQSTQTFIKNTIFAVLIATLSLAGTLSIIVPQFVGAEAGYDFPSTNEKNKNQEVPSREGQVAPYVDLVDSRLGEVKLEFVNMAPGLAFFEYRIDGEHEGSTDHPVVIGDTIHRGVSVQSGNSTTRDLEAIEYVEVRLALGGERDWDFDWTKFEVINPTPSTNSENLKNEWAHYNVLETRVGEVDIEFVSTRNFLSCFEYRSDGDTSQQIADDNWNENIEDGLYRSFCVNSSKRVETLTADKYVEVRMVFGAETDERFDWTRVDVLTAPDKVTGLQILQGHSADAPLLGCDGYTNTTQIRIEWDASQADNLDYYYFGTRNNPKHAKVSADRTYYNGNMTITANPEYFYTVIAVDNSGNESEISESCYVTLDQEAPAIPGLTFPADNAYLNSQNLFVEWESSTDKISDQDDITYQYRLYMVNPDDNPDALIRFQKDYAGTTRHPKSGFAPGTPEGTYWWRVQAVDQAGNKSGFSQAWKFTVDNTAPKNLTATFTQNSDGEEVLSGGFTSSEMFTFELSADGDPTRYQLKYWNDIESSQFTKNNPWNPTNLSNWSSSLGVYEDSFTQGEGTHYFAFSACDLAGNCSGYTDPFVVTHDNTAPVASLEITGPTGDGIVTVTGSAEEDNIRSHWFEITRPDGTKFYEFNLNTTDESYSFDIGTIEKQNGEYNVRYVATDRAGNRSDDPSFTNPTTDTFTVDNTIASRIVNNTELGTLLLALEEADLVDIFADTATDADQYTVFAPVDSAFAALLEELEIDAAELLADPNLGDILNYHVVAGTVLAGDLTDGQVIETLQGTELIVEITDGDVFIIDEAGNRAEVVTADVEASNGVVHLIDSVLLFAVAESGESEFSDGRLEVVLPREAAPNQAPPADPPVGGGIFTAAATAAPAAAGPVAVAQAAGDEDDDDAEDVVEGEILGDATTTSVEDEGGQVAGVVDEADEAGWLNWAWVVLALAGLATLWLLAAARRRREEE